ncbi:uncharacterized protein [Temnothorax longispinosus]|uniref:uncharacterized protein isoform X1 n=1 Tax=Temnothorax longispinosus TaxID=300112 RepID=UPI003A99687D
MAARTGDGGGETPATVLDDNAGGIVTTAGPLAESSTSSSSSSSASAAAAVVPTVILTESTATSAGRLPLTGSQQQSNLHQVHQQQQQQQQQQSRQRVNLIADVVVNDVAAKTDWDKWQASSDSFKMQVLNKATSVRRNGVDYFSTNYRKNISKKIPEV